MSFTSGTSLHAKIEALPDPGPRWFVENIVPISGESLHPISLYYRDPLEAIKSLLRRPSLADSMEFAPRRVWSDKAKTKRLYSEMPTGEWWWREQVLPSCVSTETCSILIPYLLQTILPVGGTVIPVLLGSDKTHLTVFAGDKKAWPLYLSIGNILSKVRNTPSKDAWILIGYIPITQFHTNQTAAEARLFHQCVRHILKPLVDAGNNGTEMADSKGDTRFCFPLLAGHIADYPEQILIACAAGNNSPVTTAGFHQLDDAKASPPRTYKWTMCQIRRAMEAVNPANMTAYHEVAKNLGLNDVYEPYWKDFPRFRPELVICPDILHGLIRLWRDHLLKWIIRLVGHQELDSRLKALQHVPGWRYFRGGIKHLSQWTGREDRELQRTLVAVVANAPKVDKDVMRCIRAFHDFLYVAQYRSHSDITIGYLKDALRIFHATKKIFITNKSRRGKKQVIPHFRIPKLAGMHVYIRHIPEMGSSPQFSTEIVESLHRPMAKDPYRATNRKDFVPQMCRVMDRAERIRFSVEFLAWAVVEMRRRGVEQEFELNSPGYRQDVMNAREEDYVAKSRVKQQVQGLTVNKQPKLRRKYVPDVLVSYQLANFADALARYSHANELRVDMSLGQSPHQLHSPNDLTFAQYFMV